MQIYDTELKLENGASLTDETLEYFPSLPLVVCDENDKIIDLMNDSFYNSALNNTEEYTVFVANLKNETADSIIVQQEEKKVPKKKKLKNK
jgi:hypothetical protein